MCRLIPPFSLAGVSCLLTLLLWQPAGAQDIESRCFGIIDYAHELRPRQLVVEGQTALGDGLTAVVIGGALRNRSGGDFLRTEAWPAATQFDLQLDHPMASPLTTGPIAPGATGAAQGTMTVVLPDAQVAAFADTVASRGLALTVHAAEKIEASHGNKIGYLSGIFDSGVQGEVTAADADGNPVGFFYPALDERGLDDHERVRFEYLTPGQGGSISARFGSSDPETWWVMERLFDEHVPDSVFPQWMRNGRIESTEVADDEEGTVRYHFFLRDKGDPQAPLGSVVRRGSFCTGEEHDIAPQDGRTRQHQIDSELQAGIERSTNVQGIRFNRVLADGIELSGQVQAHALRPGLQLSVRPGSRRFYTTMDADLSLSASLRAITDVPALSETIDLYDMCFPLPPLMVGPITVPLSLHVGHDVHLDAAVQAGLEVGLQKRVHSGYAMGWDSRRDPGREFFTEGFSDDSPMAFTAPRLLDDTAADLSVGTSVRANLNVGTGADIQGRCLVSAGVYLDARAGGGLTVQPTQEPWWHLGHDAAVSAGVDMELLGFSLIDQQAELLEFTGEESLEGHTPMMGGDGRSAGEQERWAFNVEDQIENPPGEMEHTDVTVLADGRVATISHAPSRLAVFDADGAYEWDLRFALGVDPISVHGAADGTLYVTGTRLDTAWAAAYDGLGTLLWSQEFDLLGEELGTACRVQDATLQEADGQAPVLLLVGYTYPSLARACALASDHLGNPLWSSLYTVPDDFVDVSSQWLGATALADGGFALVGPLKPDAPPFASDALLARVDAQGQVTWAATYAGRATQFVDVAEAADGSLYATGMAGGIAPETEAGLLVARFLGDGSDAKGTLIYGSSAWETRLRTIDNTERASIMASYHDGGTGVVPSADGVIVVGRIGADVASEGGAVAVKVNSA
ncbi:MAG: hypothetical protein AAF184_19485, partial [Pseudomonadota bacterium]